MIQALILFEDSATSHLYPITLGRPAYGMLCGSYRLIDLVEDLSAVNAGIARVGIVREHVAAIQQNDYPHLQSADDWVRNPLQKSDDLALWLNARLVPHGTSIDALSAWLKSGEPGMVMDDGSVAAALLPCDQHPPVDQLTTTGITDFFSNGSLDNVPRREETLPLMKYPHDMIRWNREILADNLQRRIEQGGYREVADGVFADETVTLHSTLDIDTRLGPIVLDADARVGPFVCLNGPMHIGARTRVIEHAAIKEHVSIGHTSKIGGEVEASVIESFTNKQHHGFLGHSYLGSWINLGAGTCNSDLKNTYGEVNMDYHGHRVATGMQFLGCIMGDYAKTAINTGIFTGKLIGACSMLYGFVTTNVPSFVNYARTFGQISELPPKVMIATQERMFKRRNVRQRPCDCQMIHDMYYLTQSERRIGGDPLAL